MIPPTSEPPRPSATVAYHGIGSGPGSAQRARPPMMKPPTIARRMKRSKGLEGTADGPSGGAVRRSIRRLGQDGAPLSEEAPDDGDQDDGDDHAHDELQQ